MKKIQCPNIKSGENVHLHTCECCNGKQHIPFVVALKYVLRGLLVLSEDGNRDATDIEMFNRIDDCIKSYSRKHNYKGVVTIKHVETGEPISTLNACINTLVVI